MSRQPELYRTPQKPGYLGGYNWPATCLGLLLLVVVNFAATQYVAARFRYQPALGSPLTRLKTGVGVYEPFAWIIWGAGTIPRRRTRRFGNRCSRAK